MRNWTEIDAYMPGLSWRALQDRLATGPVSIPSSEQLRQELRHGGGKSTSARIDWTAVERAARAGAYGLVIRPFRGA